MEMHYIREISKALAEKHAAVMVGAGFSRNADKVGNTENEFLTWNRMSDVFYERLYESKEEPGKEYNSSLRLAQEVEIAIGRPTLEAMIRKAVPDQDYVPSDLHSSLMQLPWNDVFTTNYDTLLERAAEFVVNRRYNVVTCQEDLVNSNDAPRIIKLHGSFPAQRPFIITEEDYRTYPVRFAAMVNTVQQALLENVFCMLGFACEDPNFIEWIGWIHDHLGKSSSQKIYMVSVSHISDAKQKIYFSRNIIVIDLEKIWPEKSIHDRLKDFFAQLAKDVEEREQKKVWGELKTINLREKDTLSEKAKKLRHLRLSYPGWIFMPWEIKNRMRRFMDFEIAHICEYEGRKSFLKAPYSEQLEIMFEYLKIHDIAGRPILSQVAELFLKSMKEADKEERDTVNHKQYKRKSDEKKQYIWLQLYRTYRELADWELMKECRSNIQVETLGYEERQFLYAEECKYYLFRFQHKELSDNLEQWRIAGSDVYWPLIKAYFYANIGEKTKAEVLLMDNLTAVRKQLTKKTDDAFLSSIEESVVSLLNFIRQDGRETEFEKCFHGGELSWWDENNNYCLRLQAAKKERPEQSENYQFNLGKSYSLNFGNDISDEMTALEYWRFLEQTGHAFRLGMVANKAGLEGSVSRLCIYYPYWSVVQILVAREEKYLNYLYGRVQLSCMTAQKTDAEVEEYLNIFAVLINQVGERHAAYPRTIYDQAAGILPMLIARLCSKCTAGMLERIFEMLVELNSREKLYNFSKTNELFRGLLAAYTTKQQMEKLPQLLAFPMKSDRLAGYVDPIVYINVPEEKIILGRELYAKTLQAVRQNLEDADSEVRQCALDRLTVLQQVIKMEAADEKLLFSKLQEKRNDYLLYSLQKRKSGKHLDSIIQKTISLMQSDGNGGIFSPGRSNYAELIYIMKDVHFVNYDLVTIFQALTGVLTACEKWHYHVETHERIRECCMIAHGIMISLYKDQKNHLREEIVTEIDCFLDAAEHIYRQEGSLMLARVCMVEEKNMCEQEVKRRFWLCNDDSLDLLCNFLRQLIHFKINIKKNKGLQKNLREIAQIMVYRFLREEAEFAEQILRTLEVLNYLKQLEREMLPLIDAKMEMLLERTQIGKEDSEETAIRKIRSRIAACRLACELFKGGYQSEILTEWRNVTKDPNEFVEVRKAGDL